MFWRFLGLAFSQSRTSQRNCDFTRFFDFFFTFWSKPGDVIVVMISDRRGERDGEHMTDSRTARSFLCTYTGCTYILMVVPRYDMLAHWNASTHLQMLIYMYMYMLHVWQMCIYTYMAKYMLNILCVHKCPCPHISSYLPISISRNMSSCLRRHKLPLHSF